MPPLRLIPLAALPLRLVPAAVPAAVLAAALALPGYAVAQTANGSPTAPASPGLVGTPAPISRTPPSVGTRRGRSDAKLAPSGVRPLPKPTAADLAEQRKLEHDLRICIGC